MMSDRGVHPDLLDEELEAQHAPPPEPETSGGRRGRAPSRSAARAAAESPPAAAPAAPEAGDAAPDASPADGSSSDAAAGAEPPEWFAQVRDAKDPTEALRAILKNVPYDQLEKDEVFSGLVGRVGDRRARQLLDQQQREHQEQAKREAAQRGDLYALGELSQ